MKISDALGVTSAKLWKQGVYDSYLGIDSRLHLDPALLRSTRVPEFRRSLSRFEKHFNDVLTLAAQATPGTVIERQAIRKLVFPEIPIAALGYSQTSTSGRGVTPAIAAALYKTAREVIEAGIKDPAIFELAVIFEEKFGPDLISDMTLVVILEDVNAFNSRVCSNLNIPTKQQHVRGIGMPVIAAHAETVDQSILLIPHGLLAELPEATCREDIDRVVAYNAQLRDSVNRILGKNWSNLCRKLGKAELKRLFIENPSALKDLLRSYKKKRPKPYDFENDPLGEIIWEELGVEAAASTPVKLSAPQNQSDLNVTVSKIAKQFKKLVEVNGHAHLLFDDSGRQRHEKFSQLLFFSIADSYCKSNNLDLSREPNAGRGPVDFKLSQGQARVLVELKLSSNSKALDGLLRQLPEYAIAEDSPFNIFLLLIVGPTKSKVGKIKALHRKLRLEGKRVPELIIVDAYVAYEKPSASNLFWGDFK